MSDLISLFRVSLRDSVPFKSAVDNTLLASDGELKLDLDRRVVLAKAHSIFKHEPLIIPLENVKHMVELTDAHTKLIAEKAKPKAPPAPAAPEATRQDRTKFVKDELGQIVEVKVQ